MNVEAAGTKRECQTEANEAGRKKAAGPGSGTGTEQRKSYLGRRSKTAAEWMLELAVARRSKENPDAPPIVPERLTAQERAALVQEENEHTRKMLEQRRAAERAARGPSPEEEEEEEDPNLDDWDRRYNSFRDYIMTKPDDDPNFTFEAVTSIPAMCFTDRPMPGHPTHTSTVQIFTVKVAEIDGGLGWPIQVFGIIAVRDKLDYNRNVIFSRARDNPQTLTQQDPYFVLTGPSRAVLYDNRVYLEAVLKVKGATESEDKDLSLLLKCFQCRPKPNYSATGRAWMSDSCVDNMLCTSKLSTLEFMIGHVMSSIEATIALRIIKGSWPDGSRGHFSAHIDSLGPDMEVMLLDSGEDEGTVVAASDGMIELSRRVVTVESYGQLVVRGVVVRRGGDHGQVLAESKVSFAPLIAGRSRDVLDLGVCELEVTVAWSRVLQYYVHFSPLALDQDMPETS